MAFDRRLTLQISCHCPLLRAFCPFCYRSPAPSVVEESQFAIEGVKNLARQRLYEQRRIPVILLISAIPQLPKIPPNHCSMHTPLSSDNCKEHYLTLKGQARESDKLVTNSLVPDRRYRENLSPGFVWVNISAVLLRRNFASH